MIKVESFSNHLITEVDCELEDFIKDHEIRREDIITIMFYSTTGEDGYLYHYARLVYDNDELIGGVQDSE